MIVVIADDLTGAAELGGIGLHYNLNIEVNTGVNLQSEADLLVVAMDTRSKAKNEALAEAKTVAEAVAKLKPEFVFKKVDSVLRGYVAEELAILITEFDQQCALVIPANPALGRTIVHGEYLLNTEPLHHSNFANDPEFPAKSSSVIELLQQKGVDIHSQQHHEALATRGIIVGDTHNAAHLEAWAEIVDDSMIVAGASGFFTALMDRRFGKPELKSGLPKLNKPILIVSGTAFKKSSDAIQHLKAEGMPVSFMPSGLVLADVPIAQTYQQWYLEIEQHIANFGKVIIAINATDTEGIANRAKSLREKTAVIVAQVFKHNEVKELLVEGGATAFAILQQLNINQFKPVQEIATGVVRMQAVNHPELHITIKPGSYSWPEPIRHCTLY